MKLRVWNMVNLGDGSDPIEKEVATPREAFDWINREANRQLKISWIHSNAFGLEVFNEEDQMWEEWQDEDGCDLDEHARLQDWK